VRRESVFIAAADRESGDIGTAGGRVYEIDITSLEVAGLLQLPDAITNAVAISADESRIYVSTAMNSMLAYERL
jgi:sugar lactone lactonase YvrE